MVLTALGQTLSPPSVPVHRTPGARNAALSRVRLRRGLTQAKAAALFGVSQPRVSDLTRGKIDRFSIDTLVAMLGHAGISVQFTTRRKRRVA